MEAIFVVVVIYLLATFLLAFLGARHTGSTEDYYIGGRKLGGFITGWTYIASTMSASGTIGAAGLAYGLGAVPVMWIVFAYNFALVFSCLVLGPKLREYTGMHSNLTLPEYFGHRLKSRNAAGIVALILIGFLVPAMVVQFVGSGYLLQEVAGLSYATAVVIFGILIAIYASLGGFLGVAYSDTMQGIIGTLGMIVIVPGAVMAAGGWGNMIESIRQVDPVLLSHVGNLTPLVLISICLSFFAGVIGKPEMTIRFFAVRRSKKDFALIVMIAVLVQTLMVGGPVVVAMAGTTLLPDIANPDMILFQMVSMLFHPIFAGIVLAALLAIMMSTVDSMLLIGSSSAVNDLWERWLGKDLSKLSALKISRIVTLVLGFIVVLAALNPPEFITLFMAYAFGAFGILIAVPLVACLFWDKMTLTAAYVTWLVGILTYVGWEIAGRPFGFPTFLFSAPITIIALLITGFITHSPGAASGKPDQVM